MDENTNQIEYYIKLKKQREALIKVIDKLNKQYHAIINPLEEILKTINEETNNFDDKIYIKIGDLIDEVSEITNIPKEELKPSLSYMRSTFPIFSKRRLEKESTILMFEIHNGKDTIVNTSFTLNFSDKMADGHTLIDITNTQTVDILNLMIINVDKNKIEDVMFKINYKDLNRITLESKAIMNCLEKQKYMTEEDVNNLKPKKETNHVKSMARLRISI